MADIETAILALQSAPALHLIAATQQVSVDNSSLQARHTAAGKLIRVPGF
jgi:hypothetical protein